jgi:hypothetical protein
MSLTSFAIRLKPEARFTFLSVEASFQLARIGEQFAKLIVEHGIRTS